MRSVLIFPRFPGHPVQWSVFLVTSLCRHPSVDSPLRVQDLDWRARSGYSDMSPVRARPPLSFPVYCKTRVSSPVVRDCYLPRAAHRRLKGSGFVSFLSFSCCLCTQNVSRRFDLSSLPVTCLFFLLLNKLSVPLSPTGGLADSKRALGDLYCPRTCPTVIRALPLILTGSDLRLPSAPLFLSWTDGQESTHLFLTFTGVSGASSQWQSSFFQPFFLGFRPWFTPGHHNFHLVKSDGSCFQTCRCLV